MVNKQMDFKMDIVAVDNLFVKGRKVFSIGPSKDIESMIYNIPEGRDIGVMFISDKNLVIEYSRVLSRLGIKSFGKDYSESLLEISLKMGHDVLQLVPDSFYENILNFLSKNGIGGDSSDYVYELSRLKTMEGLKPMIENLIIHSPTLSFVSEEYAHFLALEPSLSDKFSRFYLDSVDKTTGKSNGIKTFEPDIKKAFVNEMFFRGETMLNTGFLFEGSYVPDYIGAFREPNGSVTNVEFMLGNKKLGKVKGEAASVFGDYDIKGIILKDNINLVLKPTGWQMYDNSYSLNVWKEGDFFSGYAVMNDSFVMPIVMTNCRNLEYNELNSMLPSVVPINRYDQSYFRSSLDGNLRKMTPANILKDSNQNNFN